MIKNERQRSLVLQRLSELTDALLRLPKEEGGLPHSPERLLLEAEQSSLAEQLDAYEQLARKGPKAMQRCRQIGEMGRCLVELRIACGLPQRELAHRLGVSDAQISRDEKLMYPNISMERVQRILDAMNVTASVSFTFSRDPAPTVRKRR